MGWGMAETPERALKIACGEAGLTKRDLRKKRYYVLAFDAMTEITVSAVDGRVQAPHGTFRGCVQHQGVPEETLALWEQIVAAGG